MTGRRSGPKVGRVTIVGGGMIGLWVAHHLRSRGVEVVVLERDRIGSGAARGNAGEVCPGLSGPLPAPGVIAASLRTLHRSDSALYVRPHPSADLVRFLAGFAWHARADRYAAGVRALAGLAGDAVEQYRQLAAGGIDVRINDRPYLSVFDSREHAREALAELRRFFGEWVDVPERVLESDELQALEPGLVDGLVGYAIGGQVTVDASAFVTGLAGRLREDGAEIVEGARVTAIRPMAGGVAAQTTVGRFEADAVVLTAGVWSPALAATLGARLPIIPGKGYSFSVSLDSPVRHLISVAPAHVALAPMGQLTRVAGTMEIDREYDRFDRRRVEAIVAAARPFIRGVTWEQRTCEWMGPRPMTSSGLPFLGALDAARRVYVAAGHNMLGVTLGPGTGRVMADLILDGTASIDLGPFRPRVRARG